jgi:hypothetical protein
LGRWQRQHAWGAAEAHGWQADDAPAVGSDFDGAPALIGEIEIDVAGMLREAPVDRPLGTVKLSLASNRSSAELIAAAVAAVRVVS